jgi:hypothetical protein
MIKKVLEGMKTQKGELARINRYRQLLQSEAKIGGELFGTVPEGTRREFFCLDDTTWVWHEEWLDQNGQRQVQTTRYDVRPSGILKAQDGRGYQMVSQAEAQNLIRAVKLYRQRVLKDVYRLSV